jgi:hypothetical protein
MGCEEGEEVGEGKLRVADEGFIVGNVDGHLGRRPTQPVRGMGSPPCHELTKVCANGELIAVGNGSIDVKGVADEEDDGSESLRTKGVQFPMFEERCVSLDKDGVR